MQVEVKNTGSVCSDYVTLGFLTGEFGPKPYPKKTLVKYARLFNVTAGSSQTASLNWTLGSLARVDANGNTVLYPGDYSPMIDTQPLAMVNVTLTGSPVKFDEWLEHPVDRPQQGDYFVSGYQGTGEGVLIFQRIEPRPTVPILDYDVPIEETSSINQKRSPRDYANNTINYISTVPSLTVHLSHIWVPP